MAAHEERRVVVQNFPAGLAGEKVAYINTQEHGEGVLSAVIAYATVGAEGAEYSYEKGMSGPVQYVPSSEEMGLLDPAELGVSMIKQGLYEDVFHIQGHKNSNEELYPVGTDRKHRSFGDSFFLPDLKPDLGIGKWAVGEKAIFELLREITEADLSLKGHKFYAGLYYNLALLASSENIIADPNMSEETDRQIEFAQDVVSDLNTMGFEDQTMRSNLTVFSEIEASGVPKAFVNSRRKVAKLEEAIIRKVTEDLYIGSWYPPVGFRPSGRTWPYMDATEKDETKAFGHELRALEDMNISPADHELTKEMDEIEKRLQKAGVILKRLGELSIAETERTSK